MNAGAARTAWTRTPVTGRNNATRRFLERIKPHEATWGWGVAADAWVACSALPDARR